MRETGREEKGERQRGRKGGRKREGGMDGWMEGFGQFHDDKAASLKVCGSGSVGVMAGRR